MNDIYLLTGKDLSDLLKAGKLSASTIVEAYLKRIEMYDGQIGAFLRVYKDRAREKAKEIDQKMIDKKPLGRLAGIPIAIKDNIHIKGEISSCASKFLVNYRPPFDATVTRLLEEEDAILIGKTNMDEFAMGSSTENSALQLTRNPWDLKCTPGGSSGGSAAAVAARFCPIALGSDTGGSIRQPAAFCGIVGFKPTYGRVSRYGLVAYGSSFDQIGPMTTNTVDAALIMEVLGKHCEKDSTSIQESSEHYLEQMTGNIKGLKIGVPKNFLEGMEEETKQAFDKAIEQFKSLGAQIVDVNLDIQKYCIAAYYILATAEASTNLARFDGIRYGERSNKAQTLEEVYTLSKEEGFGAEVKRRILLGTYVLSAGYQDAYYKKAQKARTLFIQHYNEAFKQCDLVAMPPSPFPAFELGSIKDPLQMYLADIYTIPANLAGIPAISIPIGFTKNHKPLGIQLHAPQKKDVLVFQAAYALEKSIRKSEAIPEWLKK